jgi:hypothetical protein
MSETIDNKQLAKKKKLLLLCDDIRFTSGVSTMARELVFGTLHKYDWCQMAGAISHPEQGKIIDLSDHAKQISGIKDAYIKLYPVHEYGNEQVLFQVMQMEKPDAILHFTDPRYWTWLYAVEKQVRSKIPITYLSIWDSLNYPSYNRKFYQSCDSLFAISKQTDNIHENVLRTENCFRLK